jgi:protein TonB
MFDTALIESGGHDGDDATVRKLPFAIGFHAAVIGALVYAALVSIAEPPEPLIPIVFPSFAGGPPPPPPGGAEPIRAVIDPKPKLEKVHLSPVRLPEQVSDPAIETAAETTGVNTEGPSPGPGEPGGQPGGLPGGIPGGTGTQDTGIGHEIRDEILIPAVGGVTIPELIEQIQPVYPETSRKLGQEGAVVLEAIIASSGTVHEVRIASSRGPLLDEAAMAAVRQWRYRPATLHGRAVAVRLTVVVRFGLNR